MDSIGLRVARPEDAPELLTIYAPYVEHTAITFEYTVPSLEQFRQRMSQTLRTHPYLVVQSQQELLGYAYTGPFVGRQAYQWSAETTIYLKETAQGMGLGRRLYTTLEAISKAQNIQNLYACIAYPQKEDAYLSQNSAEFHQHLGFSQVGRFCQCGCKFDTWYDMIWMEKIIGTHPKLPLPVIPFPALKPEVLEQAGIRQK